MYTICVYVSVYVYVYVSVCISRYLYVFICKYLHFPPAATYTYMYDCN